MKYSYFNLLLFILTISSLCYSQTQDVVYLKNGSIIRGTIIEIVPEKGVKIQMLDGSIFVYEMKDVEKITKESNFTAPTEEKQKPEPVETTEEVYVGYENEGMAVYGGLSFPVGDFGNTEGITAGYAKLGFSLGLDINMYFARNFSWISTALFSLNSMEIDNIQGASFDTGSWALIWSLTGIKGTVKISETVNLFGLIQGGVLFGFTPEIGVTTSTGSATQSSAGGISFGYGGGIGMTIGQFFLTYRTMAGEPEYTINATGTGGSVSNTFSQPTTSLILNAGIAF